MGVATVAGAGVDGAFEEDAAEAGAALGLKNVRTESKSAADAALPSTPCTQ